MKHTSLLYCAEYTQTSSLNTRSGQSHGKLSEREAQVLRLIADEYTMQEIAGLLYISSNTVKTHRTSILKKLQARNAAGLVRRAFELGFLQIGHPLPTSSHQRSASLARLAS